MKYRKNGRVYRLVRTESRPGSSLSCFSCAFLPVGELCPSDENGLVDCARGDGINRVWRETLWSKIRNRRNRK